MSNHSQNPDVTIINWHTSAEVRMPIERLLTILSRNRAERRDPENRTGYHRHPKRLPLDLEHNQNPVFWVVAKRISSGQAGVKHASVTFW